MNIIEAVNSRRSVRDFIDKPVSLSLVKELLEVATRSPSGGNLQPWHIHVVSGESLTRLKALMRKRIAAVEIAEPTDYDIYPAKLKPPYRDRRFQVGEALYGQLNIPREDKAGRLQWFARNFEFFGAPVGLFFSIDRSMGSPQWSDLGMLMQTLMLLLRSQGLDSCAQECWSLYPKTVGDFLDLPDSELLFAGMAVGYANIGNPINQLQTERAPLQEVAVFHD